MYNTQNQPPREPVLKKVIGEELFYWLQTLVSALVCIILVFTFCGRITRVVGSSMDPTLADGELLFVWSLGYEPKQGDVVIVNKTTSDILEGEAIVKRIIATEGQIVEIVYDENQVYIDGVPLDEPYIFEPMRQPYTSTADDTYFEVPEGSVFVMGDNRNHSSDSRVDGVGFIDEGYIIGKAAVILFPFTQIGLL